MQIAAYLRGVFIDNSVQYSVVRFHFGIIFADFMIIALQSLFIVIFNRGRLII
ncbi:hypothetical protein Ngar_c07370 [Candidatus Nitrososphaera gargensis Ga9.2]|uniref:Uncharacterized protein n=1 Tax=Nitrososphaera gargensis (strain Ga9.2) TaxID=1237085 RepID=K0IDG4_NITGG|nr:hypothetical protein Ngar_c07370 [Candidatus Nitrososphaera gargensis Ga9.2]